MLQRNLLYTGLTRGKGSWFWSARRRLSPSRLEMSRAGDAGRNSTSGCAPARPPDRPIRGLVDYLIHHAKHKVAILHLCDRPHADHRYADDRALRDRRVDDPLGIELVGKPEGHCEAAAKPALDANDLADQKHPWAALHCYAHGVAQVLAMLIGRVTNCSMLAYIATVPTRRKRWSARPTALVPGLPSEPLRAEPLDEPRLSAFYRLAREPA